MATASQGQATSSRAQQNRCRLFRLQMLIIDGGLQILRNIFDKKRQNVSLSTFLQQERSTITKLRTRGIITQVQYDQLFPSGGNVPTTTDIDIALIICLLRNIKTFGLNKNFQWNSIPAQGDTSVEADMSRLKIYRNELSHISSTSGITLHVFTTMWSEIEQVLLRLNSAVTPIPDLQMMIDDYKVNPLDPHAERRVQKAIDSWHMLDTGVQAELKLLKMEDEKIKSTLKLQDQITKKHTQSIGELNKKTSEHNKQIHDHDKLIQELKLKEETRKDDKAETESKYKESKQKHISRDQDSWHKLETGVEADLKLMKMEGEKIKSSLKLKDQIMRKHMQRIDEINKKTCEHAKIIQELKLKEETRKDDKAETESKYEESKQSLRQYLQGFYSKSASFYNFRSDLEGSQNLLLRIGPTFRKLDITHKEDTVMNQNEEMTESLQMPKYIHNGFRRSRPILLLTKDTTSSANFIVSSWLNFGENHTFFPMNMQTLDGVFLLKIAYVDDVSDLNKLLENTFQMKDFYYTKKILVIFEFIHTNHFKLKAVHDLACFCNLKTCSFIIIINIDKQVVVDLELNIEVILIAEAINALHVYSRHTNVVIDGSELSRRIDQIVSERNRDAITKMCFENIHPINSTAKICVPVDIKYIRFHRCSHKFQVMHCANHLDISEPQFLTNPLTENIFTPQLSTLAIHFKSPSHIFYNNIYKHFACNITKANHIVLLRLCNMNFGKKVINVELQKEEIKQIKHSIESKEDYCRFGARILGPRLEKISFDKEDVEMERSNSLVKQIMLDLICYELVKTHSSVSECYPSETNDGAITLICFVNDEIQIDSFNGFRLLKRCNDYISKESLLAENACDIEDNTIVKAIEEEFKDINETLSFHAEALMTSHRNLEAAKVSFVQPKDIKLVPSNLCIVLYCKAKGYIPFGDVCFPRTLNHPLKNKLFRTDVREGFFSRCHFRSGHSTDFNKKLVLGSSIGEVGGNHSATLGPFVNIKETNTTCFLTVRHVFAPLSRTNESLIGVNVVQPADVHLIPGAVVLPNRHCGMVIACQTGGQIDASLVAISPERLPTSGQFLQLTKQDLNFAGLTIQPTYNDGRFLDAKTLTVKDLATRRIIKIGCTTSLTKGLLSTTDGCVRETLEYSSLETFYNGSKESFKIQSQIMVDSLYKKVFSQSGDSGSGVFLVDDKNSLHCIGMLIGVCSDMTAVVTPINNILQILGHKMGKTLELKKFREKEEMDES